MNPGRPITASSCHRCWRGKTLAQTRLLPEWYHQHGVTVRRDESVLAVEMSTRTLRTQASCRGMSWCLPPVRAFIPPLPGVALPHVFAFRTFADVAAILATGGPAVVIGGGVLGVEAAAALRRHGDNVTLLHRGDRLMEQQTDAFAGQQLQLEARGIQCVTDCAIAAIREHEVVLEDGGFCRQPRGAGDRRAPQHCWRSAAASLAARHVVDRQMATARPGLAPSANVVKLTVRPGGWWRPVCAGRGAGRAPVRGARRDFHWQDSGTRLKVTGIELFSAGELQAGEQDDSGPAGTRWPATTVACWSAALRGCCWATAQMPRR
jgi:nitrite reductase (NADH) large subunit